MACANCSSSGLLHAGYTAPQIGALSGHKDLREIQIYIDEYDRQKVGIETSTAFEQVRNTNRKLANLEGRLASPSK